MAYKFYLNKAEKRERKRERESRSHWVPWVKAPVLP